MPKVPTQSTISVDGGSGTTIEKEASDWLAIFIGLLFTPPILDSNGELVNYKSTKLIDNVREVFEYVSSTTD